MPNNDGSSDDGTGRDGIAAADGDEALRWEQAQRLRNELVDGRVDAWLARASRQTATRAVESLFLLGPTAEDMRGAPEERGTFVYVPEAGGLLGEGEKEGPLLHVPSHADDVDYGQACAQWCRTLREAHGLRHSEVVMDRVRQLLEHEIRSLGLCGLEDVNQSTVGLTFEEKVHLVAQHRLLCRTMAPAGVSPPPQQPRPGNNNMYLLRVTASGVLALEAFAAPRGRVGRNELLARLEGVAEPYAWCSREGVEVVEAQMRMVKSGEATSTNTGESEGPEGSRPTARTQGLDADDFFDTGAPLLSDEKSWSYCLPEEPRSVAGSAVLHHEWVELQTEEDFERIRDAADKGRKAVFMRTGKLAKARQIAKKQDSG